MLVEGELYLITPCPYIVEGTKYHLPYLVQIEGKDCSYIMYIQVFFRSCAGQIVRNKFGFFPLPSCCPILARISNTVYDATKNIVNLYGSFTKKQIITCYFDQ